MSELQVLPTLGERTVLGVGTTTYLMGGHLNGVVLLLLQSRPPPFLLLFILPEHSASPEFPSCLSNATIIYIIFVCLVG